MTISDIEVVFGSMVPALSIIGFTFVSGYLNPRSHEKQYSFKTLGVILLWLIGPVVSAVGALFIPLLWYSLVPDDDGIGLKSAGRIWPFVPALLMFLVGFYFIHLYVRGLNAYGQLMELEKKP